MEDAYLAYVVRYVEGGGEPVKVSMALTSGVVVTGFEAADTVLAPARNRGLVPQT